MATPLEKTPTSVGLSEAPWPPSTPNKRPTTVRPGESFLDICKRENCAFSDLMKCNFQIDINQANLKGKWEWVVNYYLHTKLHCSRLTAGGNYLFSGGEVIYIPTIAAIDIDLTEKVNRIGVRRTTLDKTVTKSIFDFDGGGTPMERAAEKWFDISWGMTYKGYDPNTGMYMGSKKADPSTDRLLFNPKEQKVSDQPKETDKSDVLVLVNIHTLVEYVGPKRPDSGLNVNTGGEIWHRRREFVYGPGRPDQQVKVVQDFTIKKADGSTELRTPTVTYVQQPENLDNL
jgi:hypothetical protein